MAVGKWRRRFVVRVENQVAAALPDGQCTDEHPMSTGEVLKCCLPVGHVRDPGKAWHYGWSKDGGQYAWRDEQDAQEPGR